MIIVDTNVISEFMGTPPGRSVLEWLNAQDAVTLYITSISVAEIELGLQMMPVGKHQQLLSQQFEQFLAVAFDTRILGFDAKAAKYYANCRATRRKIGRPISTLDAQIAGICRANGFVLATRNIKDFEDSDIELVNPFEDPSAA
ncbi:MAG: type II toxin-antitoxin system VapC family toxin [Pseudomonadales bacterium]